LHLISADVLKTSFATSKPPTDSGGSMPERLTEGERIWCLQLWNPIADGSAANDNPHAPVRFP